MVDRRSEDAAQVVGVGRAHDGELGDRAHDAEVFEGVMAGAVEPHRHPGVMPDDAHRQAGIGAVGADLLAAEQRRERGERRRVGDEARRGHAGRDADHVLLGDAEVEEAVRMPGGEVVGAVGLGEIGGQHGDAVVMVSEIGQFLTQHEGGDRP